MIANDHQARRLIHLPSILAMLVLACGCSSAPEPAQPRFIQRSRVSMGSQLTLSAWTTSERGAEVAFEHVFREFDRLESLLSVWKDGSDVVRLNQAAGIAPVKVSRDTIEVLRTA
ncbi:MAG TPA: FAD:protein FMN transferase, partial [Vicinamibacterales bacterium]|nr:FAD:protein FMN transferase [Vicinamibacterales bacterium]